MGITAAFVLANSVSGLMGAHFCRGVIAGDDPALVAGRRHWRLDWCGIWKQAPEPNSLALIVSPGIGSWWFENGVLLNLQLLSSVHPAM